MAEPCSVPVYEVFSPGFMHALGVPTSRSLTLYTSLTETVRRPWYSAQSRSINPDILVDNQVAITTRVAPSFLRVGQLELFARRARSHAHPNALNELDMIVRHLIERNYRDDIDQTLTMSEQVLALARFSRTVCPPVADWLRVGYCQAIYRIMRGRRIHLGLWFRFVSADLAFNLGPVVVITFHSSTSRLRRTPISRCL